MARQIAIIGLDTFGKRILEELSYSDCDILLIDKDEETIEVYKDQVAKAYTADVLSEATIEEIIPSSVDGVVVDLGDRIEVSILVTNYLKKRDIRNVFVRAETDEHGEILELIGADMVVYPNREAAKRIAPMLLTSSLFNYMPISNGLAMAEVRVPQAMIGKTIIELDLRKKHSLNVIAVRKESSGFEFIKPDYCLSENDIFLLAGQEEDIKSFGMNPQAFKSVTSIMSKLFGRT